MPSDIMENVSLTMQGVLCSEYCVPGIENAFADGQPCAVLYAQALEAYEGLRIRLNAGAEDDDIEIIIDSLLNVSQILAYKCIIMGLCLGAGRMIAFAVNNLPRQCINGLLFCDAISSVPLSIFCKRWNFNTHLSPSGLSFLLRCGRIKKKR